MDWGRAKSVLILAFLLLNIVLAYQLWTDIREQLNANVNLKDLQPETLSVMQQKNIQLGATASIPDETPKLRDLTYRITALPEDDEREELPEPVDSKIIFSEKELLKQLGGIIPDLELYAFDPAASEDGVFVLYRMVDGRPMYDVELKLYYRNQKIEAYSQKRVELSQTDEAKEQTVLPASRAIGPLITNYLPNGTTIKEIRLGYHGQIFDSETQVAAPAWRVLPEEGKPYFVHAISGEVFSEKDHAQTGEDDREEGERTGQE